MNGRKKLIGQKIKEIRKKNGYTQENFSEIIGIEPSSLSNIENGKSFPSMHTVLNVMDKFKISPQFFFDFEYFEEEENLEEKLIKNIKKLSYKSKQIVYKIVSELK